MEQTFYISTWKVFPSQSLSPILSSASLSSPSSGAVLLWLMWGNHGDSLRPYGMMEAKEGGGREGRKRDVFSSGPLSRRLASSLKKTSLLRRLRSSRSDTEQPLEKWLLCQQNTRESLFCGGGPWRERERGRGERVRERAEKNPSIFSLCLSPNQAFLSRQLRVPI